MRGLFAASILLTILLPVKVYAIQCSSSDYTIIYVNGILTAEDNAKKDKDGLKENFIALSKRSDVVFINGYNPSHIAGFGDWFKSVEQAYKGKGDTPIDDYDLRNILLQIHDQVTTRKILLVGHSQGTFYTNALYLYLTENGVPKESIRAYNLATPASYVAGDGKYLTSANDRLIIKVRELAAAGNAKEPLPANALIPLPPEELNDPWGGHHFSSDYLAGDSKRIISEIDFSLRTLSATSSIEGECFAAPSQDLAYHLKRAAFAVADPAAVVAYQGVRTGYDMARYAMRFAYRNIASVAGSPEETTAVASAPAVVDREEESGVPAQPLTILKSEPEEAPPVVQAVVAATEEVVEESPEETIASSSPAVPEPTFSVPQAGFGGGGAPPPAPTPQLAPQEIVEPPLVVVLPPASPVVTVPADFSSPFSTTTILFSGTASSSHTIFTDFSSTTAIAGSDGSWALSLSGFSEGTTTLNFYASDANGTSTPASVTLNVTLPPPAPPSSPLAIGYYCYPHTSTFLEGGQYTADPANGCHYLSESISGSRWGTLFRGVQGNATIVNSHSLGLAADTEQLGDVPVPPATEGENFFVAIFQVRGDGFNDLSDFHGFFTASANDAPHANYGILNFTYAP